MLAELLELKDLRLVVGWKWYWLIVDKDLLDGRLASGLDGELELEQVRVNDGVGLDIQNCAFTIGAFQVVGRDADRRVLEVQVLDVDASMLLSLSEVASVMTAGIKLALKAWFLLSINERRPECVQDRVRRHGRVPKSVGCWHGVMAGQELVSMGCKA